MIFFEGMTATREKALHRLSIADPSLAEDLKKSIFAKADGTSDIPVGMIVDDILHFLSAEIGFGMEAARGFCRLLRECPVDAIFRYRELLLDAMENGPTFAGILALHFPGVLVSPEKDLEPLFFETVQTMLEKGVYTLKSTLSLFSELSDEKDFFSAKLYLELLKTAFGHDMPYNRSLHLIKTIPRSIRGFRKNRKSALIPRLTQVMERNYNLLDPFLEGIEAGLDLLSDDALDIFIHMGLTHFQRDEKLGIKFLSLESGASREAFSQLQTSVSLSQVLPRLKRYLHARTGKPLTILPLSKAPKAWFKDSASPEILVVTDGDAIYLPDEINYHASKKKNEALYMGLLRVEAAYHEFGTFHFDLEKALFLCRLPMPDHLDRKHIADTELFFRMFDFPHIAEELFLVFEHARIRFLIEKSFPGIIRKDYPVFENEFRRLCGKKTETSPLTHLYGKLALGMPDADITEPRIRSYIRETEILWKGTLSRESTVESSAQLVFETYPNTISLLHHLSIPSSPDMYPALIIPFGRTIRYDLFLSKNRRWNRIAADIRKKFHQKGITIFHSDIRKQLIQKEGNLSIEDFRNMLENVPRELRPQETAPGQSMDFSWLKLEELNPVDPAMDPGYREIDGLVYWYREWDFNLNDYLGEHVRLVDRSLPESGHDFYNGTLRNRESLIRNIRRSFEMMKPAELEILRQWREGDEFDYRALIDYALDRKAGVMPSDRLFIKKVKNQRNVSVLLLVDMSRSTSNPVPDSGKSVLDVEKEAIVLFCEALQIIGDDFAIAGFSGTGRLGSEYLRIKNFDEPLNTSVKSRIAAMAPRRNTRMGVAIRHAIEEISNVPSAVRILILLGDGFPNDTDYKKDYAVEDTRHAILEARSRNIHVKAITVNLAQDPRLDELYGNHHHMVISDVRELPEKLLRIYSALTKR